MSRHAARIAAPADEVYARIADPHGRSAWLPELERTTGVPDRPLEPGDHFVGYASVLAHRFVGHSDVVVADHDAFHIEEQVIIGARFRTAWTVTPTDAPNGGGCEVVHELDVELPEGPLGRIERWVLGRYLDRLQRKALRRLVQRSEAAN